MIRSLWLFAGVLFFSVVLTFGVGCTNPPNNETNQESTTDASETTKEAPKSDASESTPEVKPEPTLEPKPEPAQEPTPEPTTDASEPTPDASEPTPENTPEPTQETTPDTPPAKAAKVVVFSNDYVKSASALTVADVANGKIDGKLDGVKLAAADSVVKYSADGSLIYVLSRYNNAGKEDTVTVHKASDFSVVSKSNLGKKANPYDIVDVNGKVYISLYGRDYLLHGTLGKLASFTQVDLSSLAEKSSLKCSKDDDCKGSFGGGTKKCDTKAGVCQSDGLPEASKMLLYKGRLYVLIQGLDRNQGFKPVKSCVAEIDTSTNKLQTCLPLKGTNPTAIVPTASADEWVIVLNGTAGKDDDSGLQMLTPGRKDKVGRDWLITKKELGAASMPYGGELVYTAKDKAYIVINDKSFKQLLVKFDPTSQTPSPSVLIQATSLAGLALLPNGWVVVGDKGSKSLRVFDSSTDTEDTAKKLKVTDMNPAAILLKR